MSAEIICVGTELLLGEILNSNAQFIAQQLADLGVPHYYQTVVGDNPDRLKGVIATAQLRGSKILIFTGGLGPTPDDLTTEAIADFFQTPLIENPEIIADITQKFAQRGRLMTDNNRKQALIPQGARVLPNPTGTAPGMIWQVEGLIILTFPGVPREMVKMWQETAVSFLKSQGWGQEIIYSRTLRFWGIGEATLAEKVSSYFDLTQPTVAPYAGDGEVRLRVSARSDSPEKALEIITPVAEELQQIAGMDYFGAEDATLASTVGKLLQARGETLAVAESCTGGLLGQKLTATAGSSGYFMGGIISYDNTVKRRLLGVNRRTLDKLGAVSEKVAKQMAQGVRKKLRTSWGLSVTGIAGPDGGSEEKPVGLVYIGLSGADGTKLAWEYRFGEHRNREGIRYLSACNALDQLRRYLLTLG